MKEKIVKQVVEVKHYIAADGKEFESYHACKEYDDTIYYDKYKLIFEFKWLLFNEGRTLLDELIILLLLLVLSSTLILLFLFDKLNALAFGIFSSVLSLLFSSAKEANFLYINSL